MSEKEREIGRTLADAFAALPPEKKERLLGYAEGVADMKRLQEEGGAANEAAERE